MSARVPAEGREHGGAPGAGADSWVARSFDAPPADPLVEPVLFSTVIHLLEHPGGDAVLARLLSLQAALRHGVETAICESRSGSAAAG
ncbi:hypothetical protein [Streptomyces xantholiticus]|uniref:hypothetical protein n=1 Tax=Streptomyces xantholiticus TaxID=68285 RepID=UPI0016754F2C|nr:hypothetical protein [Streptomyces xantholiticus]GGW73808.1 hypothetical protein GCM10010381_68170 [Streptomyces xantholiticus]